MILIAHFFLFWSNAEEVVNKNLQMNATLQKIFLIQNAHEYDVYKRH